jgi:hypothetical protein
LLHGTYKSNKAGNQMSIRAEHLLHNFYKASPKTPFSRLSYGFYRQSIAVLKMCACPGLVRGILKKRSDLNLGLLLNFNVAVLQDGIVQIKNHQNQSSGIHTIFLNSKFRGRGRARGRIRGSATCLSSYLSSSFFSLFKSLAGLKKIFQIGHPCQNFTTHKRPNLPAQKTK